MPLYTYTAIDPQGAHVSGQLEANDPDSAVSQLTVQGLRVENIQRVSAPDVRIQEEHAPALSAGESRDIGSHIAAVISAGVPLEGGLAAVAEEFPAGRTRRALRRIVRRLEAGEDLESVLATSGAPRYLPALVRAGRRSGRTAEILENFVAGSRSVSELRQTLWMALAYPLFVLVVTVPLGLFLIVWLIPSFAAVFDGFGIQLPWMTTAVIAVSRFLTEHGGKALLALASAVVVLCLVMRVTLGAVGTRRLVGAVPVIGPLVRWLGLSRFSPILSLLIESRVPLDEALLLAGEASGDAEIRHDCRELAARLQSGKTLASAARETRRFPQSFARALSWERYQEIFPEVLQSMSEMYAGRARILVAVLMAVVPPLAVTLAGLVIGFIVVALFMPLIELLNKLS
ncbi:MAG: type II secretion system F family protein [Deltaproteobacteria bacterium]